LNAIRNMDAIGLIAAMTLESDALLRGVHGSKICRVGTYRGSSFELAGRNCVLVTSGMGTRKASEAARTLIETVSPICLVSFGIAGAVEADLAIGDVVAAEAVCRLERGEITPQQQLKPWSQSAREAASRALSKNGAHLYIGTAITTGGSQVAEDQLGDTLHPILEMETAGIAQAAGENGVPILSIRAISDGPRAPIPFNLGEIMDENGNLRAGGLITAIIRHPGIVLKLRGLIQNTKIAAANVAMAVLSALGCQDI
jgi:nucleoside phosphorylase